MLARERGWDAVAVVAELTDDAALATSRPVFRPALDPVFDAAPPPAPMKRQPLAVSRSVVEQASG